MTYDKSFDRDPFLQHPKLTVGEMATICDTCNPGFRMQREMDGDNPEMLAAHIRSNVLDSFRLYPGTYEAKWGVDREIFTRKLLSELSSADFEEVAKQVDGFWEAASHG